MAYNKVILAGTVLAEPEFNMDAAHGDVLNIKLHIRRNDIGKAEVITVSIFNDELMGQAMNEISQGDYLVITNARIITTNYNKVSPVICPVCQNVEYKSTKAEKTEVEVFDYQVMKNIDESVAIGINKVFLLGNVCSALNFRPGSNKNGKDYIKYKLAVNRSGKKDKNKEKTADYPFIVSFNQEATSASKYLKLSSVVLVEGAVQEREISQKNECHCSVCHNDSAPKAKSIVREIITTKVDYLYNINTLEDIGN